MKIHFYIWLISLMILSSCQKDELGVNSDVALTFSFSSSSNVEITKGQLVMDKFTFTGNREEGNDVEINDEFDSEISISLPSGTLSSPITYDLPEGLYTENKLGLRLNSDDDNVPTIKVEGFIKDSKGNILPFLFELDHDDIEYETMIQPNESNNKVLITNEIGSILVSINIDDWFSYLTPKIVDNLDQEATYSPQITVSKDRNTTAYEIILADILSSPTITLQ